jgi:hypothetical protein
MSAVESKKSVGGIWEKTAKNGSTYLSIKIGDTYYAAFKNDKKDGSNQPDWRILPPLDRDNTRQQQSPKEEERKPEPQQAQSNVIEEYSIPF